PSARGPRGLAVHRQRHLPNLLPGAIGGIAGPRRANSRGDCDRGRGTRSRRANVRTTLRSGAVPAARGVVGPAVGRRRRRVQYSQGDRGGTPAKGAIPGAARSRDSDPTRVGNKTAPRSAGEAGRDRVAVL